MSNYQEILSRFSNISLEEMEGVQLLNRTDLKYLIPFSRLGPLLNLLKEEYRVLSLNGVPFTDYKTLYYDTADFKLYSKHHSGALNRYKIRHRTYVQSGLAFLEVKFKNNKGRTIKDRVKMAEAPVEWDEKSAAFIEKKTPLPAHQLRPVVWVNYRRITLVGRQFSERVTIDFHLDFLKSDVIVQNRGVAIVEVKQPGKARSPVISFLRTLRCRPCSVSKYCLAVASLYPGIRRNNFKEKIHSLKKISDDFTANDASGGR